MVLWVLSDILLCPVLNINHHFQNLNTDLVFTYNLLSHKIIYIHIINTLSTSKRHPPFPKSCKGYHKKTANYIHRASSNLTQNFIPRGSSIQAYPSETFHLPFGYSTCVSEKAFHSMSVIVSVARGCGQARGKRKRARQNGVVQSAVETVSITPLPGPLQQELFTL